MLWWRNTLNLSSCDCRRNQVSAPHRSRFIGMVLKRRYLLYRSIWGLLHTLFIRPMAAFAAASLAVMSSSSRRLYEMSEPKYWNVRVKLTKPSATEMRCVSSSRLYILCSRSVWPGFCSLLSSEELIMRRPSGWYADNDLGSMRMMLEGTLSGANMTYFFVCWRIVPPLFACLRWVEVTMTVHSTGKAVGQFVLGAGCSTIVVAAALSWI